MITAMRELSLPFSPFPELENHLINKHNAKTCRRKLSSPPVLRAVENPCFSVIRQSNPSGDSTLYPCPRIRLE